MELIYTDNQMTELGDIKDFKFDLAYGKDENDFEIKTPENEMQQGYYWYVKDTNYGGVVDEIEGTTNDYEVTYKGRSFQGILSSYSGWQLKTGWFVVVNDDTIDLHGTPYEIANEILTQLGVGIKLEQPTSNQTSINETVDRSLNVYQLMRYAFEKNEYKVNLYWDGGICLDITVAIDYTSGNYFDVSRYTVKVNKKNIPNHLVGVFKRDEEENIIKHLYADENGIIQPYFVLDEGHDKPLHDYEYERVEGEPVITGLNERVEVIEGGSNIESFDVVTELTDTNGNTEFENGVPKNWNERCYTDFYHVKTDKDTGEVVLDDKGEVQYENYEVELEDVPFVVEPYSRPDTEQRTAQWWKENWMTCFKRSDGGDLTQLSTSDCVVVPRYEPITWNATNFEYFRWNYKDYYYFVSDPDNYAQIQGKTVYDKAWQHTRGSEWNTNRGDFWFTWTRRKWKVDEYNSKGKKMATRWVYEVSADGTPTINTYAVIPPTSTTSAKFLNQYSQFDGGNITKTTTIYRTKSGKKASGNPYIKVHKPVTAWSGDVSLSTYCAITGKKLENIGWVSDKYYLRVEREVPPDTLPNPIFSKIDEVSETPPIDDGSGNPKVYFEQYDRDKPAFEQGQTYCKVNDHYTNLVQTMLDKYNEIIAQASVIEPTVNTDIGEFDVGDVIGSVHPFTNEPLTSKLTKKIIKGGTKGATVSYEIG